jgi:hypothetical protein
MVSGLPLEPDPLCRESSEPEPELPDPEVSGLTTTSSEPDEPELPEPELPELPLVPDVPLWSSATWGAATRWSEPLPPLEPERSSEPPELVLTESSPEALRSRRVPSSLPERSGELLPECSESRRSVSPEWPGPELLLPEWREWSLVAGALRCGCVAAAGLWSAAGVSCALALGVAAAVSGASVAFARVGL